MTARGGDDAGAPALRIDGPRAEIRLRRPERHNPLGPGDIARFASALQRVEREPAIRVLVVSAGGPTFCSGYDLGALAAAPPERRDEAAHAFGRLTDRLAGLRVPTVAALAGSVYGGGTDLALACDLRVGAPGIELRMSAARIGVHYYAGGMRRFVERLGPSAAKRLFLTAEAVDAEELLRIGYLNELVPAEALAARVDALAQRLAENSPRALAGMKRALDAIAAGRADDAAIDAAATASLRSDDVIEGLAAYREKRPPRFPDFG